MTPRTRVSIAVASALVITAVVVIVVLSSGTARPTPTPPLVRASARQGAVLSARDACRDMTGVQQLIRQDATAGKVLRYLSVAASAAGDAVSRDSTWRSLQSGIVAVQQSLSDNSGSLATVGIAIVRAQCRRTT